ncbi:MAG: hypothetical protein HZC40_05535 [Chloroflexi bacterium]|nr:hypothetical protein [Chloroflexota bacterium]
MDIETIRNRVHAGNYSIKSHAIQHALKEGFDRAHIVEAILNGVIIVTAYIPDETEWMRQDFTRRKRKR